MVKDKPEGENIDVIEYFKNMSFDIVGEIGFGYHFNSQTTATNEFVTAFKEHIEGVLNIKAKLLLNYIPFIKYLPFGPSETIRKGDTVAENILNEVSVTYRRTNVKTISYLCTDSDTICNAKYVVVQLRYMNRRHQEKGNWAFFKLQ